MLFYLILFLFLNFSAQAADPDYCDDLFKNVCSGEINQPDSTGFSLGNRSKSLVDRFINDRKDKILAGGERIFKQMSDAQKQVYVKDLARSFPECKNQTLNLSNACQALVDESLARFILADISKPIDSYRKSPPWAERGAGLNFDMIKGTGYEKIVDEIVADMRKQGDSHPAVKNFESRVFNPVKGEILQLLPGIIKDPEKLKTAQKAVGGVKFAGTGCGDKEKNRQIDDYASNDAIYDNTKNEVHVCYGRIHNNTSAYSLAALAAHEIAHAFDPCQLIDPTVKEIRHFIGPEGKKWTDSSARTWPWTIRSAEIKSGYRELIQCLRSPNNIEAKNLTGRFDPDGKYFTLCSDQIVEVFADWLSAEALASMLRKNTLKAKSKEDQLAGVKNSLRQFCGSPKIKDLFQSHKPYPDRINKIFGVHPEIRKQLGCAPLKADSKKYCDFVDKSRLQKAGESKEAFGDGQDTQQ